MGLRNRDNQEIWEIRVKSTSWWRYLVSLSFVGIGLFTGYVYLTGELPSFAKIKKAVNTPPPRRRWLQGNGLKVLFRLQAGSKGAAPEGGG